MIFKLNDRAVNFELERASIDFRLNDGVLNFKLNAVFEPTCFRLLQTGFRRLLENGSFRLLENCDGVAPVSYSFDYTMDFTF